MSVDMTPVEPAFLKIKVGFKEKKGLELEKILFSFVFF